MRKKFALISVLLLQVFVFTAVKGQQGPSLHFDNLQRNFGRVNELAGILKHEFIFKNKGQEPLIVTNVAAGGGISVTGWTRSPVMPGDSGAISVQFNPRNMPGRFNRAITVSATGMPSTQTLRLLGDIIPRDRTNEEIFPVVIGALRTRASHIPLGYVNPGSITKGKLDMINLSDNELDITFAGVPRHVTVTAEPEKLMPGEEGVISVTYDVSGMNDWGVVTHHFSVMVNGLSQGRNMIYVSANIQEDFSGITPEERDMAPVINFDGQIFNFGQIKHGESVSHDFTFANNGKSDLIIRRVKSGCGCTAIEPQKTLLKPGELSSIKAVFNSRGFFGRQTKSIVVISNDPANPNIVLRISGEVLSE